MSGASGASVARGANVSATVNDWVQTPIAPGATVEGVIVAIFLYDQPEHPNYVIAYRAGEETAFVVRRHGQFVARQAYDPDPTPDDRPPATYPGD